MTKRKAIIISDSSNNETISTKNKRCRSTREHKSDPSDPNVEIIDIDTSAGSKDCTNVVASTDRNKKENDGGLQNDNRKYKGRLTRSRINEKDSDVIIIESDTENDTTKFDEVVTVKDTFVNNDKNDPNRNQVNDAAYLSIKNETQQASQPLQLAQPDPPLETTENIDKDSEMNENSTEYIEKTIEQTDVDLSLQTIDGLDTDLEINKQTTQHIEKIIAQMDADPSLETIEEVNNDEQTVQSLEKTPEQEGDPPLETIEQIDGDLENNEQSVQHKEWMTKPKGAVQDLPTTEEVDKNSEQNRQTIQYIENTIKQMDACVGTEELDELLRKKQIYPWTHLHQKQKNKEDEDTYDESENEKRDQCIQTDPVAKQWQHIISAMEDPSGVVKYTDNLLIIKERQPKGRFHYLIVPIENMRNLNELKKEHMPLLKNMEEAAKEVISSPGHSEETFKFGFIAKPTMIVLRNQKFLWLHMHVISNTPNFAYITKKQIWNTFHSRMFMTIQEVRSSLVNYGTVPMPTPTDCNLYLLDDVFCHECDFSSPKLPKLIEHINEEHSHKGKGKIRKKKRK